MRRSIKELDKEIESLKSQLEEAEATNAELTGELEELRKTRETEAELTGELEAKVVALQNELERTDKYLNFTDNKLWAIVHTLYPDISYWGDTGNNYNLLPNVLECVEKDFGGESGFFKKLFAKLFGH